MVEMKMPKRCLEQPHMKTGSSRCPQRIVVPAMNGRGDWIRTSDPHTPSVMRYQAALRPDQRRRI
jgi:hypothetical protein